MSYRRDERSWDDGGYSRGGGYYRDDRTDVRAYDRDRTYDYNEPSKYVREGYDEYDRDYRGGYDRRDERYERYERDNRYERDERYDRYERDDRSFHERYVRDDRSRYSTSYYDRDRRDERNRSRSPPRRDRGYGRRRSRSPLPRRNRVTNRPVVKKGKPMNESEVESLFLEALKDLCKMEKGDIAVRLPFNVSKINDRMQILSDRKFHISNSPYPRFRALLEKMAAAGHATTSKSKDSLVISDTKYAPELMRKELTEEEKEAYAMERENRKEKEARGRLEPMVGNNDTEVEEEASPLINSRSRNGEEDDSNDSDGNLDADGNKESDSGAAPESSGGGE